MKRDRTCLNRFRQVDDQVPKRENSKTRRVEKSKKVAKPETFVESRKN